MRYFKTGIVFCLIFTVMISSFSMGSVFASSHNLNAQDVESFIDEVMQEKMETFHIANATVSVVVDGEVILAKGYGYADLEEQKRVDAERTLFRIGSGSKLFTWIAVMQLAEQGKLDLDTDVNAYLDFEIPAELLSEVGDPKPRPITLKHLMSHTPGFEDYSSDIFKLSEDQMISLEEYIKSTLPARIFPAGEVIAYSNYGTALAGYIVERVSGMPFSEYVETYIYEPIGMENSTFRQPLPEPFAPHMTKAYRYVDGEFREGKFEFIPAAPAGSMSTSASDMAQFMLALLQEGQISGERILEAQTVQTMFSRLYRPHEAVHGMAHGFVEGTFNGRRTLFHPGSTMLFNTALYLLPDEQTGLFISHSGGSHLANNELFQAFMDRYFPAESRTITSEPAEGMLERSKAFKGEYQQNRKSLTTEDKFINLIMGVIRVDVDDEGYLMVTHLGETNRFVEVEPGVYHNLREGRTQDPIGDFRTIVFGTDPYGKTMLMTDGPMSYSKAAWYESFGFTMLLLAFSILLVLGSLLYWAIKAAVSKLRRINSVTPKPAAAAKWLAVGYGILTVIFLLIFLSVGNTDPVYQIPVSEESIWTTAIANVVLYLMIAASAGLVIFTVMTWWKNVWRLPGRIHYTLYTSAALALLWIFHFWNVI